MEAATDNGNFAVWRRHYTGETTTADSGTPDGGGANPTQEEERLVKFTLEAAKAEQGKDTKQAEAGMIGECTDGGKADPE